MYKYYNQTNYPHVLYPILTDMPELHQDKVTVKEAGCGLCATCMLVENYTDKSFPLIECLELSMSVGANHSPGTDMDVLAPHIAKKFDLEVVCTDSGELLKKHLQNGYMAVACVAGDRPEEDYVGVFSHGGHFVTVLNIDENDIVTILDPSQTDDKYTIEGRKEKVQVNGNVLTCDINVLTTDCRYREPKYYADGNFKKYLEFAPEDANQNRYWLFK
jgi:hypothetical protein